MPFNYEEFYKEIKQQANSGKKWCSDCKQYYETYFCGYNEPICKIHGSLGYGSGRDPDKTADECPDYIQKEGKRWFEHE